MTGAANKMVLVVEDDRDVRDTFVEALVDAGYDAVGADNGLQALERLRSGPLPCLILLDLMMPVMDGAGFRAEQQKDPVLARVPIVVVTADGNPQPKADSLLAAAGVRKPIDLDAFLDLVAKHCR